MAHKIFVHRPSDAEDGLMGWAFDEDGQPLAKHLSSTIEYFRADMGLKGNSGFAEEKRDIYKSRYPDGYELVEVIGEDALKAALPILFESDDEA